LKEWDEDDLMKKYLEHDSAVEDKLIDKYFINDKIASDRKENYDNNTVTSPPLTSQRGLDHNDFAAFLEVQKKRMQIQ